MNAENFYDQYWANGLHVGPEIDDKSFNKTFGPLIGLDRILDYGCGMGHGYQAKLTKVVKNYVGADVGPLAVSNARQKGYDALKIEAETGKIDSPDNVFDAATCIEVFEHLFDPLQAVQELYRVLKPGGVLIATVPNFGYHAWRLLAFLRAQVPSEPENPKQNPFNGVHIRYFSKLMLTRLLKNAGFVDVSVKSYDQGSVWDVFRATGPFTCVTVFTHKYFPAPFHLRFLQDLWPNVFARRLRVIGYKPGAKT